jgi:hypothetical protein
VTVKNIFSKISGYDGVKSIPRILPSHCISTGNAAHDWKGNPAGSVMEKIEVIWLCSEVFSGIGQSVRSGNTSRRNLHETGRKANNLRPGDKSQKRKTGLVNPSG